MPEIFALPTCRRLLAAAVVTIALAVPIEAQAQVVVVVNGDPITAFDVEQRAKLIQVSGGKPSTRQAVIDELIDEKLKIQLLRRYVIDTIDTEVNNAFNNMARRMRLTSQQFTEQLTKQGVAAAGLKSRIKAEIIWGQIIRGKYQSSFQLADKDILAKLEARGDKVTAVGYDYTLRPILFVVPKASPEAFEARRREAEAFRPRFLGCEAGIVQARQLRDVAVRAPVVRSSADLPAALREVLEKTEIGKLTAPERTAQGIEVYALCDKKPSAPDNVPGKREVREQLMQEQYQLHSKRLLKELRSQAMIEYK
jgi:peptidyl-prolyl cis-trans isomerase SurA